MRPSREPSRRALTAITAVLAVALAAMTFAGPAAARTAAETHTAPFEVMSFNVRAAPSNPSWADRKISIAQMFADTGYPALMGSQEATAGQVAEIKAMLGPTYQTSGPDRVAIFYDAARFDLLGHGALTLPSQPLYILLLPILFPPRTATWVVLRDKTSGAEFLMANTHLDHLSALSRRNNAPKITEALRHAAAGRPLLVTGDFNENADPAKPVYKALVSSGPLRDTWTAAPTSARTTTQTSQQPGTFHNFKGVAAAGSRIDWVLADPQVVVHRARIEDRVSGAVWPSDHFPVAATVTIPAS